MKQKKKSIYFQLISITPISNYNTLSSWVPSMYPHTMILEDSHLEGVQYYENIICLQKLKNKHAHKHFKNLFKTLMHILKFYFS